MNDSIRLIVGVNQEGKDGRDGIGREKALANDEYKL
jgi:hypothetical protein